MNKELFKLRDLKTDDVKKYIDFLSDPEVTIWLEDEVQNIESYANIENYLIYGYYRQAIEHDGNFIGVSGLDLTNDKKKVARFFIVIGKKELWGKGIGLGVIKSIVKYGFHELKLSTKSFYIQHTICIQFSKVSRLSCSNFVAK